MKITKKNIIIAAVVAVVAYLLWKRMKGSTTVVTVGESLTAEPDHTTLDYILTHISFTNEERKKIDSLLKATQTSNLTKQQIQAKANERGISFDQQLVLDAIWLLYHPDNEWESVNNDPQYGWKLQQKVLSL